MQEKAPIKKIHFTLLYKLTIVNGWQVDKSKTYDQTPTKSGTEPDFCFLNFLKISVQEEQLQNKIVQVDATNFSGHSPELCSGVIALTDPPRSLCLL